jgi:hypothetical protein
LARLSWKTGRGYCIKNRVHRHILSIEQYHEAHKNMLISLFLGSNLLCQRNVNVLEVIAWNIGI